MHEDGCEGCQLAHVAIALHTKHIHSLAKSTVHIAVSAVVASVGGIFSVINRDSAWIVVIFVVVVAHPHEVAVVMLIYHLHGIFVAPCGIVRTPCLHVADSDYLGIFGLDGIIEELVSLCIVRMQACLIVLVSYLKEF